jgi:hypothetical protein
LATDAARVKLGARGISTADAEQLPRNRSQSPQRRWCTLTLVIERTVDPTSWLIVTGWTATERERRIIS